MSNSCPYCRGEKTLISRSSKLSLKRDFYPGIELWVEADRIYIEAAPDTYEPSFMEDEVKINFCPICGRELVAA